MRPTVFAVLAAVACGGSLRAQACNPGRVVKDPTDAYGGSNDLNGDGAFDLSDMVYGLQFLFLGGPAPCPLIMLNQPVQPAGFPATGQTTCYDDAGNEILCDSPAFPGQDGFYQAGCPLEGRFQDNGDGTVTDFCTGLMWQQEVALGPHTWQEALQYCERLQLAGHVDWRMPNIRELQSVTNYPVSSKYRIFGGPDWPQWSSTTVADGETAAWVFGQSHEIGASMLIGISKQSKIFCEPECRIIVRAVRRGSCARQSPIGSLPSTGQTKCYDDAGNEILCDSPAFPGQDGFYQAGCPLEGRFQDNGDGTVTDFCTGLMWQQVPSPGGSDWQGDLKYCEDLEFAGHDDWRLPNVLELQSTVDYIRSAPCIDPVFQTQLLLRYSSSSHGRYGAWCVSFSNGRYVIDHVGDNYCSGEVRAVRGP